MSEVIIDGETYEFEGEHKLLQFMLDRGIEVPFFCYHPSMSIPANCRQCLVKVGQFITDDETGEYELDENGERKIRWFPKFMTSCNTDLQDDMIVRTQETDEEVVQAHKDNLEFILINHPLDCPICDQAGECPLQIQTYKYGPEGSRFEVQKAHKPKRVQLGPRVIMDAERCINCTRCVRFTEEISETHQLTIVSRGDKNYPQTAPGEEFDDPYSLNTVDICPVGALTSADFRFRARVWEMSQTPSIDITNGKGCNVDLWTRDNLVLRITPRYNPEVNDYWMPDEGREAYHRFNENRISRPELKVDGKQQVKTSWNNTFQTLAELMEAHGPEDFTVLGSPHASVESNYVLQSFFNRWGVNEVYFLPHIIEGYGDDFLITDDQAPNTNGCRLLDLSELNPDDLPETLQQESPEVLWIVADDVIGRGLLSPEELENIYVVYLGRNYNDTSATADQIIPITCAAEHAASYVNIDGRIQRTFPAKETKYENRRLNLEMSESRLDRYRTQFDNWETEENKIDCIPAWDVLNNLSDHIGLELQYENSRDVMREISDKHSTFEGVTYQRMDDEYGIQLPLANKAVPKK